MLTQIFKNLAAGKCDGNTKTEWNLWPQFCAKVSLITLT